LLHVPEEQEKPCPDDATLPGALPPTETDSVKASVHVPPTLSPTSSFEKRRPLGHVESGYAHQRFPVEALRQTPPLERLQFSS
jgi:hypothetical protein